MLSNNLLIILLMRFPSFSISTSTCDPSSSSANCFIYNDSADTSDIGLRFFSHSFRSPRGYDPHQCALYCHLDPRCKSFNYLSVEKVCELNDADRRSTKVDNLVQVGEEWVSTTDGLVEFEGSRYYSREAIRLKYEVENSCSSSPCPPDHVCSSAGSGSYECQKTTFTKEDFMKQWGAWGEWSACGVTCGNGVQERIRECETPDDFWLCEGDGTERRLCGSNQCPIWSYWGSWSDCDTDEGCGFGTHDRTRECLNGVEPNHGSCPGSYKESSVCRRTSCDAPVMLSSGVQGDVYLFDDTNLYQPVWRQVCEPKGDLGLQSVKLAVCASLGLYLDDDDVQPAATPNDDDLVFEPVACGLKTRRMMRCLNNGWIEARNCGKVLAVKCKEKLQFITKSRCNGGNDVILSCGGGKEIKIKSVFFGRTKGTKGCSNTSPAPSECAMDGIHEQVQKICDYRDTCSLKADYSHYGPDPCPGTHSFLWVKYSCVHNLLPFFSGMKDGSIGSGNIASSSDINNDWRASMGTLDRTSRCWLPKTGALGSWLRVKFNTPVYVLGFITQGRPTHNQWVTSFKADLGDDPSALSKASHDNGEHKLFLGNTDRSSYAINLFDKPIPARYARVVVQARHGYPAVRMEWLIAD